jgi:hypothetical protein
LLGIVNERLGDRYQDHSRMLASAMDLFRNFRESGLEQKPSTAELLQWLLFLSKRLPAGNAHVKDHPELKASLSVLVKPHNPEERQAIDNLFSDWLATQK